MRQRERSVGAWRVGEEKRTARRVWVSTTHLVQIQIPQRGRALRRRRTSLPARASGCTRFVRKLSVRTVFHQTLKKWKALLRFAEKHSSLQDTADEMLRVERRGLCPLVIREHACHARARPFPRPYTGHTATTVCEGATTCKQRRYTPAKWVA